MERSETLLALLVRWRFVWRQLGALHPDEELFSKLVECYSEPHRGYHTIQHLEECLDRVLAPG